MRRGLIPAHAGKILGGEPADGLRGAHPRSRGENISALPSSTRRMGSSPLTRGKCQPARRVRRPQGLIPAHAGKIGRGTHGRGQRGAHPRSRGENLQRENCSRADQGSSPLTRGKYGGELGVGRGGGLIPAHAGKITHDQRAGHRARLIPAHAGKMKISLALFRAAAAHPRSRGENHRRSARNGVAGGSSPLTRGKCPPMLGCLHSLGLIPAHAGKMRACDPWPRSPRAHPRSRGENRPTRASLASPTGSSPLTRGKSLDAHVDMATPRLIPAHAGKIRPRPRALTVTPAHPRSRGENRAGDAEASLEAGSSPLTRGKFVLVDQVPQILGLIPAHAGKICSAGTTLVWNQAHPRSRGENRRTTRTSTRRPGSSPLTRGKYTPHGHRWKQCRLIPAHAGKISPPS